VLIEAMAGTQSLADELRSNGTPSIEFLERWGSDLLDALRYLEREGRWHRDIKPDNLGVTEIGPNKEQHLVLFDFSLAAVPSTDLRAGTPTYLEPFLADRKTKQWDLQAERYAAAVTLYEMATGEVPRWGDGRSDPAFTTNEVVLDAPLFDSAARDPLEAFFSKALKRNPAERFGNAEEMLRAWQRVFEGLDVAGPALPHVAASTGESNRADVHVHGLPTTLAIGDPVISLGVGAKVVSALNRLGVSTVRQLADLVPIEVNRARRISPRIRRRIVELRAAVLTRFADELASAPLPTAVTAPPAATGTLAAGLATDDAPRLDLDRLMPLLVSATPGPGQNDTEQRAVRMLLGLEPAPGAEAADWASQTAIADAVGVTRGRLGQIAPTRSLRWWLPTAASWQCVRSSSSCPTPAVPAFLRLMRLGLPKPLCGRPSKQRKWTAVPAIARPLVSWFAAEAIGRSWPSTSIPPTKTPQAGRPPSPVSLRASTARHWLPMRPTWARGPTN
jgi:hypothetical protein